MNIPRNKINDFNKDLAAILAQLAYHISPDIVKYIAERNKNDRTFFEKTFGNNIDIVNYLFDGSDCVFPGVRRWDTQKGEKLKYNKSYEAIIDDNGFPRHIWCFLFNGKPSSAKNWKNFEGFELAHIFAHKEIETNAEKSYFKYFDDKISPFAQFTSASNVVLLPKGTVRPTDNSTVIKLIFFKRHIELYGEGTVNGRSGFRHGSVPDWYSELKWNDPFKPDNWEHNINVLLDYRNKRILNILKNADIVPDGIILPASTLKGTRRSSKKSEKDNTKYLLNGQPVGDNNGKCALVRAVVRMYVEQNPNITFTELKDIFPDKLNGTKFGVINTYDKAVSINDGEASPRYSTKEPVDLNNDERIVVCTQWNTENIAKFIDRAKKLGFEITENNKTLLLTKY
jgi:hypothetical protein